MQATPRQIRLADNYRRVADRVAAAAESVGRTADEITIVAVTKYVSAEVTRDLVSAGCHELGENRPQAFWDKAAALADLPIRWHFIGHLQRNKLKRTLPHVGLLHSVDSLRLLDSLAAFRTDGPPLEVLLEVNVSGDAAKHGFSPDELAGALEHALSLGTLQVRGLMTMAGLGTGLTGAARDFARLRTLRDRLQETHRVTASTFAELSMGMSGDFEVAIQEGATLVRVGSLLFEGVA